MQCVWFFDNRYDMHFTAALWTEERIDFVNFSEHTCPTLSPKPCPSLWWYKLVPLHFIFLCTLILTFRMYLFPGFRGTSYNASPFRPFRAHSPRVDSVTPNQLNSSWWQVRRQLIHKLEASESFYLDLIETLLKRTDFGGWKGRLETAPLMKVIVNLVFNSENRIFAKNVASLLVTLDFQGLRRLFIW